MLRFFVNLCQFSILFLSIATSAKAENKSSAELYGVEKFAIKEFYYDTVNLTFDLLSGNIEGYEKATAIQGKEILNLEETFKYFELLNALDHQKYSKKDIVVSDYYRYCNDQKLEGMSTLVEQAVYNDLKFIYNENSDKVFDVAEIIYTSSFIATERSHNICNKIFKF